MNRELYLAGADPQITRRHHYLIERSIMLSAPNLVDVDINKKLYKAAKKGDQQEVERLLQDPRANPNKKHVIDTPLEVAAKKAHPDVVQLLLEHGADLQKTSPDLIESMIRFSAPSPNVKETLRLLINAGLDINRQETFFGDTPLAQVGSDNTISNKFAFPIIKMLLDAGARKNIVNDIGETAVERAQSASKTYEKSSSKIAAKLRSRALFIALYPGDTPEEISILNMVLRYYSNDKEISDQAKEEIEQLPWQIKDKIDAYLHDDSDYSVGLLI
jgi:ankyrin repeat protein